MSEVIVLVFVLSGTVLSLLSSFGILRLPDVYTRAHAGTKTITIGLLSILFGAFLYFWFTEGIISVRLALVIIFVFLTAPVGGHLIARSAYRSGVRLADISIKDELGEELARQEAAGQKRLGGSAAQSERAAADTESSNGR